MQKRFSDIKQCRLSASDGMVGNITDLLIEDDSWNVRYLVVGVDNTLPSRQVLVSPAAIVGFEFDRNMIATLLSLRKVIDSPLLDWNSPISRQYEEALVNYYGWPIYWLGRTGQLSPQTIESRADHNATKSVDENPVTNLRSAAEICGYNIQSNNRYAGVLKDLVIRLSSWTVEYATTEPSSRMASASSMFSTRHIDSVNWSQREMVVDLSKAALEPVKSLGKASPGTATRSPITSEPLSSQPFRTT